MLSAFPRKKGTARFYAKVHWPGGGEARDLRFSWLASCLSAAKSIIGSIRYSGEPDTKKKFALPGCCATGWCENTAAGTVRGEACGTTTAAEEFQAQLAVGSKKAKVRVFLVGLTCGPPCSHREVHEPTSILLIAGDCHAVRCLMTMGSL